MLCTTLTRWDECDDFDDDFEDMRTHPSEDQPKEEQEITDLPEVQPWTSGNNPRPATSGERIEPRR